MEAVAQLAPLLVIAGLFWLLLIRPAQRRQKLALQTQRAATVGSEVMLSAGIFGTVTADDDDTLQVEIAPGTSVKVARGAVARVVNETERDSQQDTQQDEPAEPGTDEL